MKYRISSETSRRASRIMLCGVVAFGCMWGGVASAAPKDEATGLDASGRRIIERSKVTVKYSGLPKAYAEAIATIASSTYRHYERHYHFDMPDRLFIDVTIDSDDLLGIWIENDETIRLAYERERELTPPRRSGVDTIYGLTYRIADLARARTLGEAPWLSDAAARGLSHLCACRMIDQLYVSHGSRLWPAEYDYVDTGWRELRGVINRRNAPETIRAAAQWHALERDFNPAAIGDTLATWRRAGISMRRPADDLRNAIAGRRMDTQDRSKMRRWFRGFEDICVWSESQRADFEQSFNSGRLARDARVLKYDDDASDGATAVSKGGHITTFQSPPDQWYLDEVRFHAKRYGDVPRSGKDFTITVFDERFNAIASWRKPYGLLRGRDAEWRRISVPVTRLPARFVISLDFGSTQDVGVQLSADSSSKGHSASGDLRRGVTPLQEADWMVRVEIDRHKADNPLTYRPE